MDRRYALLALLIGVPACDQPPQRQHFMPQASAERGRAIIARVGCASCHSIPGIDWPQGRLGPPLDEFATRTLIAGQVPNRADQLSAFVQNAPAVVPGTGMPAMPMTAEESRDVAAYLYTLRAR